MRIKSTWFRSERPKGPAELAGAAAFIAWRVAEQALRSMRRAGFEIEAGGQYFDFLSEWLVFLTQAADRLWCLRMGTEAREEFTASMANRLGEILAGNWNDLLGSGDDPGAVATGKAAFIDLLNLRSADYADFDFDQERADYALHRYLAHQVSAVLGERERIWVYDQVMEIEAPEALSLIRRGMRGLFGDQRPAGVRRGTAMAGGE